MDVTPYVTSLREDLLAAAAAGDEQTQRTAALLAAAIEPAARLNLLHALADLAGEVTEALGDERTVEVRLDGRQVRVALTEPAQPSGQASPPPFDPESAAGDVSRITLRLMEQLKNHAEQAASSQGVSLNSWISQAVQGALYGQRSSGKRDRDRGRSRDNEHRLRGWVQG
ncbi:MAG: toxin-antitoxin system HicB family antitoxin [Pseudonocardiales bacterium]|nr:toxin-antitoxin system HicB family antitoxin [Pseudonocardiales bacterium]